MEQVILVDDHDIQIGVADKETIHTSHTPLHRAFSLFLFNSKNQLLVTRRAITKKTFPGVWTNSVCGHVSPGETTGEAVIRRVAEELHISTTNIKEASPYRYRFTDRNGIVENEICPIFVGMTNEEPIINPNEVDAWKWMDWQEFLQTIRNDAANIYSPWCKEEAEILEIKRLIPQ